MRELHFFEEASDEAMITTAGFNCRVVGSARTPKALSAVVPSR